MKNFIKVISIIASSILIVGIILVVSGFLSGGRVKSVSLIGGYTVEYQDVEETFGDAIIENLDIEVAAGKLNIVEGDTFNVKASNIVENKLDIEVRNKTLCVKEKNQNGWDWLTLICFFDYKESVITVTIPSDFVAKKVELETKAGPMTVDKLIADKVKVDVFAGKTTLDNITANSEMSIKIGAGTLTGDDLVVNNLSVDVSTGSCNLTGAFYDKTDLDCSAGSIDFETSLEDSEYNYDLSQSTGSVRVNGDSYKEYDGRNVNAANRIKADASAGSIKIETK